MNKRFFCIKFELYIYENYKYKDKDCEDCEDCIYRGVFEDERKVENEWFRNSKKTS